MNEELKQVLDELGKVSEQTIKVLNTVSNGAEKLSTKNSATLFGTLGFLIGIGLAFLISTLSTAPFVTLSIILASIGIVLGIIFQRGLGHIFLERTISNNKLVSDEILERIKSLSDDAPYEVRAELWLVYRSLNANLHVQANKYLEGKKSNADQLKLILNTENLPNIEAVYEIPNQFKRNKELIESNASDSDGERRIKAPLSNPTESQRKFSPQSPHTK